MSNEAAKVGPLALRYVQRCADTWLRTPMPLASDLKEQALAESLLMHGVALFSEATGNARCAELLRELADGLAEGRDVPPPAVN